MTRHEQLNIIEAAKAPLSRLARESGIPLHCVEYIVPFVETDFGLNVHFFLETDDQVSSADSKRWTDALATKLLEILESLGYPHLWLQRVCFYVSSHEHVVRDFQGSYFYYLR